MPVRLDAGRDRSRCQFCDAHVSDDFRRTLGDEENVAHRCLACDSMPRLQAGSAAGLEVEYPDPADHPNRLRGRRTESVKTDGGVDP